MRVKISGSRIYAGVTYLPQRLTKTRIASNEAPGPIYVAVGPILVDQANIEVVGTSPGGKKVNDMFDTLGAGAADSN